MFMENRLTHNDSNELIATIAKRDVLGIKFKVNGRASKQGFALVIALGLMAFVLLLLLSISTLVRVESSSAQNGKDRLRARMNAQLGAYIALGNLQKMAGSDQRVTARADILLAPNSTPLTGAGQWTGVWSSKSNTSDAFDQSVGLDQHQPQWLVSGDISNFVDANNRLTSSPANAANTIKMATLGSSVEVAESEVVVPTETILGESDSGIGKYAYWVSDDGVKARVNLNNPYADSSLTDSDYYSAATAQQGDPSAAKASDSSRPYLADPSNTSLWKNPTSGLDRVVGYKTLPLVGATGSADMVSRQFYHDFTVHSKSVLSDVKNGGLKQDLSTALIDPAANGLTGQVFSATAGGTADEGDPGGPRWTQLGDHYRLAHDTSSGAINFRLPTNDQVGITPVVTRLNFVIQAFAEKYQTLVPGQNLANDYRYTVGIFPLITLWNPYDEDLVIPDLGFQTDMRGVYLTEVPEGDNNILDLIKQWGIIPHPDDQNRGMMGMTISGTTIPAGTAINFAPPVNSYINWTNAEQNVLVPGASAEFVNGFYSAPVELPVTAAQYPFYLNGSNASVCMAPYANVDTQVTNLYATTFEEDPNLADRFLVFATIGPGGYYRNHPWYSPRVIDVDRFGEADFSFIQPQNASAGTPFDDFSPIDLATIRQHAHTITGIARIINFPKSDVRETQKIHLLSQMNPRAQIIQDQMHVRIQQQQNSADRNYQYRMIGFGQYAWWQGNNLPNFLGGTDSEISYVGLGNTASYGNEQSILFEAPTRVPLGIGQFMHANLSNIGELSYNFEGKNWYSNLQQPHTTPAYAIGNSIANIHLPLSSTKEVINSSSPMFDGASGSYFKADWAGAHYDYSYELNDALWDRFYMSTILPDNQSNVSFPLPNARMTKWKAAATDQDLTSSDESAAHIMLEGGFNVNSTSVAAWTAVLGALRDVDTLGQGASATTLRHNFSRFTAPEFESTGLIPDYGQNDRQELIAGFRSLSDDQISDLAGAIVKEIRTRRSATSYPFLSLSDFINRSISPDDVSSATKKRFAYMGALQFAIDQSSVNGKPAIDEGWQSQSGSGLWDDEYISPTLPSDSSPFQSDSIEVIRNRPFMDAAPGALTQADILAKVGSILTARSDTFTIRGYGSANTITTGKVDGSAYCEMIVQRTPEYYDNVDENYDVATDPTNQRFGRKFEIVSFRWLSDGEI